MLYIFSILLYGGKSWTLVVEDRLQALEMYLLLPENVAKIMDPKSG
jgi:hypothetical protein